MIDDEEGGGVRKQMVKVLRKNSRGTPKLVLAEQENLD